MSSLLWKVLLGAGGGAAAAFDPSTVSGYVRDWNFADATKLYSDTGHTTLVSADADPIGAVLCSAGSGVYLTAPADANRPTYKTGIQNGNSVGRFDGSDDRIRNLTAITADASQTFVYVVKVLTAASKTISQIHANAEFYTNPSAQFLFYANSVPAVVTIGGTATNWNIVVFKFTSTASMTYYVNGGAGTTIDPSDSYAAETALVLGATLAGATPVNADFGRVMVYSAALADADLNYVIGGLGTAWNISTTAVS